MHSSGQSLQKAMDATDGLPIMGSMRWASKLLYDTAWCSSALHCTVRRPTELFKGQL